jgi:hypothetical protein
MKHTYKQLLIKKAMKIELKNLKKALGMVGIQVTDHQTELVVEFCKLLDAKGQDVTLGDVERVGDEVQKRATVAKSIVNPMQLNK